MRSSSTPAFGYVRRTGKVSLAETVVGNRTRVKVVKNKCAPPFTEAEFDIRWGTGIDAGADLVEAAALAGVLEKNGSHYLFDGKSIGQGRDKTRDAILTEPALFQAVRTKTIEALPSQAHRLAKAIPAEKSGKTDKPDKKSAA